jgi:class 3 adenylate cyclase/tetratricopeptide (TPR) repeat protein
VEAGFAFCPHCGAALVADAAAGEERKTVTVLFCDVIDSTVLGEALDPEALRSLLARYFERMKAILERHGGTVEKFIGDAVMAVFGVPIAHEDDALRALRAAIEMREVFPELGIEGRIGIATGEVVMGTEERLATGDAVNVAQRLEVAASSGEILLGEETFRLANGAAEVRALSPLMVKGKREPLLAFCLLAVNERSARHHESRFIGRDDELSTLHQAWKHVLEGRRCVLVTVVGEAGIGKSRLVFELMDRIKDEAEVFAGRCLPYGEGITYWPVVEAVKQLGGLPSDPNAAAALQSLLGKIDSPVSAEEIAWGFRKLLEQQAKQRPLVCVFDDLQWGEETFLDLVEHLALLSSDAPILLLCMARPELCERRPSWPIELRLNPLAPSAALELLPETLSSSLREEIARSSAGNPLFLIEMAAMVSEDDPEVIVPPSLKALLAARLDQCEPAERHLLQCAAIEGEIFHRGGLLALAPEEPHLTRRLASLIKKELLYRTEPQLPGEDAFRFRHLLFRDAAYEALPKAIRARLHGRFADWLQQRGPELVELDELAGYHLEQSANYKQELGAPDAALGERASRFLAVAGRRAAWRGDMLAADGLLHRALELSRSDKLDVALELDFAIAHKDARIGAAMADAVADRAREHGDMVGEAVARTVGARFRVSLAEIGSTELEALARTALPLVERSRDNNGLAQVWAAISEAAALRCCFEEATQAAEAAIVHSPTGSQGWSRGKIEAWLYLGPRPADEALRSLDRSVAGDQRPWASLVRAGLLAMCGRFDEAWSLAGDASLQLREQTGRVVGGWLHADVATLAGDPAGAVRLLKEFCDSLEQTGARGALSSAAPDLGHALCALGRYAEAEPLAQRGRELGVTDDLATQALWRQVQARVNAHRGESAEAETLAREAVALVERTDALNMQGGALCDLAEVLSAAGRTDEAVATLKQASERFERKKNLAMLAQIGPRLLSLQATRL